MAVVLACAALARGGVKKIELPLFEGGAGKDFFLDCAREYELQGTWEVVDEGGKAVTLPSPGVPGEGKGLVIRDGKFSWGEVRGTYTDIRQEKEGRRWNLVAENLVGTVVADAERLSGELKLREAGGERVVKIRGNKRDPVVVDLYLDPRIEDKVRVRILEGSYFETTNCFINYWPLIANGKVLECNKYLEMPNWEGDAKWKDTFLPGSLEGYIENGKIYGIPLPYFASVVWYNKAMFRKHGWKTPVTWDEFFSLCETVKKAGVAPLAFQGRYPYYAKPFYESAYYHMLGADAYVAMRRLMPGTYDCPASIEALRLTQETGVKYFQQGALGMSHTESQLQFFLGNTAMIPCGSWLKSEMLGKIPAGFELGCFNLPIVKNGKGDPTAVYVQVEPFVTMKNSPNPDEAMEFLRFMTSRRMAGKFARMQDIPTAIRGANEGNLSKDLDDLNDIVNRAKTSYGTMPGEQLMEFEQPYRDGFYQAISGNMTPAQIAKMLESRAQAIKGAAEHPDRVIVNHRWEPAVLLGLLAGGTLLAVLQIVRKFRRNRLMLLPPEELQPMRVRNVLLFVGPALAIYTIFIIVPCVRSFTWSLHRWNGLTDLQLMPWVGWLNFRRLLFESDMFWISLGNNLFLMVVVPLFVVPLALFLSACISRGIWGSKFFRVVFFFPNLLGGVAATLLWLHVYNPQGGLINGALTSVGEGFMKLHLTSAGQWLQGFGAHTWLESKNMYWSLIPISIWGACGFNMVLYLAAMETIPETYYEAAKIDGASPWRQFWTITVPLIWDVLAISMVFLIIGGMKAFEVIWLLTNQQPQTANHVVSTLMIQTMFQDFRVGEATAMAVILFLMIFIGSAAMLKGMKRDVVEM